MSAESSPGALKAPPEGIGKLDPRPRVRPQLTNRGRRAPHRAENKIDTPICSETNWARVDDGDFAAHGFWYAERRRRVAAAAVGFVKRDNHLLGSGLNAAKKKKRKEKKRAASITTRG